MDPLPPPPPRPDVGPWGEPVPAEGASGSRRPQLVTAAGVILIVLGGIQCLAGLVFLVVTPEDLAAIGSIGNLDMERVARGLGVLSIVIGLAEVLAGILVLRGLRAGRILGLVLSFLGLVGGVGNLTRGTALSLLTVGLYAFVIYALFAHGAVFERARRG